MSVQLVAVPPPKCQLELKCKATVVYTGCFTIAGIDSWWTCNPCWTLSGRGLTCFCLLSLFNCESEGTLNIYQHHCLIEQIWHGTFGTPRREKLDCDPPTLTPLLIGVQGKMICLGIPGLIESKTSSESVAGSVSSSPFFIDWRRQLFL